MTFTLGEYWDAEFIFELSRALFLPPDNLLQAYTADKEHFRSTARHVLDNCVTPMCKEYIVRTKTKLNK